MKDELQKQLTEKYPEIFQVSDERRLLPFPMFGIECGNGWYDILNALCFQIQQHIDWVNKQRQRLLENNSHNIRIPDEVPQVVIEQVKEKFGTLRFYVQGGDEYTNGMISMAEAMSAVTCEVCGNRGQMRGHGWFYTACDQHTREEDLPENVQDLL